jgi:tRNA G18 (ribose-2'-O)-methylase SpoU
MSLPSVRGYFGIGVEEISKAGNVGALMRTAHAFGASFCFFVAPSVDWREIGAVDTSAASEHLPVHEFADVASMHLPKGCALVGVELTDDAVELPSFRHPPRAAYVLGPEKGSLSPAMQARCDWIVKIPTRFCVNVGLAGALVMYDRMISLGRFAERPVRAGGPSGPPPRPRRG